MLEGGSERAAKKLLEQTYFVTPERSRLCVDASRHTLEAVRLSEPTDLSVYIGIPFCPTRCSYCSFVSESIERFGAFLPPYLAALHREIEYIGKAAARVRVSPPLSYTWAAARRRRLSSAQDAGASGSDPREL